MTEWRGSGVSEASEVTKQARDGASIGHKAIEERASNLIGPTKLESDSGP